MQNKKTSANWRMFFYNVHILIPTPGKAGTVASMPLLQL
jgi:hypothetical protein